MKIKVIALATFVSALCLLVQLWPMTEQLRLQAKL